VLMNLGSLTTLARYAPRNLIHVIFDNESLFSTGGFPTATRTGADLAGIARAAGIKQSCTAATLENFQRAFDGALRGNRMASIVAKVEASGPAQYEAGVPLLENRFQFRRYIQESEQRAGAPAKVAISA
jgi:sulfopyruvate decarboxylase subunit beta